MKSKVNACYKIYESIPTQSNNYYNSLEDEDDDRTVIISNTSCRDEAAAERTNDSSFERQPTPTSFTRPTPAKPTNTTFEARVTNAIFGDKQVPTIDFNVPPLPTRNKAWTQTIKNLEL